MFMEKSELNNTLKLAKIKLKNTRRNRFGFAIVMLCMFLGNVIPILMCVFKQEDGISNYSMLDYSIPFMIGILIAIIIMSVTYRTTNELYSVYPQTNTSRFLSSQILYHIWIVLTAVFLELMYLLQYFLFRLISIKYKNVVLVYKFNLSFVIAGFFVLIIYSILISAIITLTATLIRKFNIYAILIFTIMVVSSFANRIQTINLFKKTFGFLLFEKSPGWFILKGLVLWLVLFVISLIINKYTVYYKGYIKTSKPIITTIVIASVIAIGLNTFLVSESKIKATPSSSIDEVEESNYVMKEIVIDASDVPKGSKINIKAENIMLLQGEQMGYSCDSIIDDIHICISDESMLNNFTGEKIIISYAFPYYMVDYVDMMPFIEPELSAYLDGTTLHVKYEYKENIKAVFIPMWSFMWQFDEYKGKDIFNENGGWASGTGGGWVEIGFE